jgi:hypothetical protein
LVRESFGDGFFGHRGLRRKSVFDGVGKRSGAFGRVCDVGTSFCFTNRKARGPVGDVASRKTGAYWNSSSSGRNRSLSLGRMGAVDWRAAARSDLNGLSQFPLVFRHANGELIGGSLGSNPVVRITSAGMVKWNRPMSREALERILRAFRQRHPFKPVLVELASGVRFTADHFEALA